MSTTKCVWINESNSTTVTRRLITSNRRLRAVHPCFHGNATMTHPHKNNRLIRCRWEAIMYNKLQNDTFISRRDWQQWNNNFPANFRVLLLHFPYNAINHSHSKLKSWTHSKLESQQLKQSWGQLRHCLSTNVFRAPLVCGCPAFFII